MRLYEVAQEWRSLISALADAEGEVDEETEHALSLLEGELVDRVNAAAVGVRELEHIEAAYRAEAKRLQSRAQVAASGAERLKRYLLDALTVAGERKVETPLFAVARQANPPRVVVDDAAALPEQYVTTRVEQVVDKKAVADALKDGLEIAGAHLERSEGVRIR
jgi:hypothetical protein